MFIIEDERHAEHDGRFATFEQALVELRRRAAIPWNEEPNVAPCTGWQTCGRDYAIVEFDDSKMPWKEIRRVPALQLSDAGARWFDGVP